MNIKISQRLKKFTLQPWVYMVFFSTVLFSLGITWGLPNTETWCPDSLAPFHPLMGLSKLFSFGYFNKYPLVHQVLLSILNIPVVISAIANSNPLEGLQPLKFLLLIRSVDYATALILIDRFVSVAMGAGIVYLVYRSATEIFNKRVGIITSVIVSLNATLNFHSHVAKVDVPYFFWSMLGLYFIIRILKCERIQDYRWCALIISLAVGTKDQAYSIFVIPLIVYLIYYQLKYRKGNESVTGVIFRKELVHFSILLIAGLVIVENLVLNFNGFLLRMKFLSGAGGFRSSSFSLDIMGIILLMLQTLWTVIDSALTIPIFIVSIFGLAHLLYTGKKDKKNRLQKSIFILAALSYYLFFIQIVRQATFRFSMPLSIFLTFYAGYGIDYAYTKIKGSQQIWFAGAASLMALLLLYNTVSINIHFKKDVRYRVEQWFEENIPIHSRIEYYSHLHFLPRFPGDSLSYRIKEKVYDIEKRKPDYIVVTSSYYYRFIWDQDIKLPKGVIIPQRFIQLKEEYGSFYKNLFSNKYNYRVAAIFKSDVGIFREFAYNRISPDHIVVFRRINAADNPDTDIKPFDYMSMFKKEKGGMQ